MTDKSTQTSSQRSGPSSSTWAVLIAVLIGGWLLTGQLSPAAEEKVNSNDQSEVKKLFKVSTRILNAEERPANLIIRGQTKSPARVHVRAETPGVIETVSSKKGRLVAKGDLLCKLKLDARQATLNEATGALSQARSDFASSNKLSRSGYAAKARKRSDKTRLEAAKAALMRAELDLKRIEIRAPFQGVIEDQPAKPGDYLRQADICATLVKMDPILLTGAVSERDLNKVRSGMNVTGQLVTGEEVSGQITFISPASDITTRTFVIEAVVPNSDRKIRAGITADIRIDLEAEAAHKVTASSLSLDDKGRVGLKIVDTNDAVRFVPVKILSNQKDSLWVSGLPVRSKVITVGHEYVLDGQQVEAVPEIQDHTTGTSEVPAPQTVPPGSDETKTSTQPDLPPQKPKA